MKKQEQLWFSHDSTFTFNPNVAGLLCAYGMAGYGRWWRLMEILRNEDDYRYKISEPFSYKVLAGFLMCKVDKAEAFIVDCINVFKLLETDGEYIWCSDLLMRMKHMEDKKAKIAERARKGALITNAKRWKKDCEFVRDHLPYMPEE